MWTSIYVWHNCWSNGPSAFLFPLPFDHILLFFIRIIMNFHAKLFAEKTWSTTLDLTVLICFMVCMMT